MEDAFVVAKKLGLASKSVERDRRPTLAELDSLMHHFGKIQAHRPQSNPMQKIIAFAIFSTRRQEEITRIAWTDFEPAAPPSHPDARVLIRDMKHPGNRETMFFVICRRKQRPLSSPCRALRKKYFPTRSMLSAPPSLVRARYSALTICIFTKGTTAFRDCLRWARPSPRRRVFQVIE